MALIDQPALAKFYEKCGTPKLYASVASSNGGDGFMELVTEKYHRMGRFAKALAAVDITKARVAELKSQDYFAWKEAYSYTYVNGILNHAHANGICLICVSAYTFESDVSDDCIANYQECIRIAEKKVDELGVQLDSRKKLNLFEEESKLYLRYALMRGKRKGFLSRIFG